MLINFDFINTLYKKLSPDSKRTLLRTLFGESKQSMAYFKRTKDTSFSKIVALADFFDVPVDALRSEPRYQYDQTEKKLAYRPHESNNISDNAFDAEKEQLSLRIRFLEDSLALKEEQIAFLMEKVEFYKERLSSGSK